MCRLAAYIGSEISLEQFLLSPEHSLLKQSWAAKEMREAVVSADGFGFCWSGEDDAMHSYKSILPIWADNNLPALGACLKSRMWLANVRSATRNQGVSIANTQPFIADQLVYLHNGYLKPFSSGIKQQLLGHLNAQRRTEIDGNTDSEYIFALIRHIHAQVETLPEAIKQTMAVLESLDPDIEAMLSIILYADRCLYLCRHAINVDCPTLYYTHNHPAYPNAALAASERFDESPGWHKLAERAIMELSPDGSRTLFTL